jgi:hypothetical protein
VPGPAIAKQGTCSQKKIRTHYSYVYSRYTDGPSFVLKKIVSVYSRYTDGLSFCFFTQFSKAPTVYSDCV